MLGLGEGRKLNSQGGMKENKFKARGQAHVDEESEGDCMPGA